MRHHISIRVALLTALTTAARASSPELTLDLTLHPPTPAATQPAHVSATLLLHNTTDRPLTIDHPDNRMAVTLVLLDSLNNVVPPTGLAKVDRSVQSIILPPRSTHKHPLDRLEFLTGSALFGFALTPGETYRLIAVYRPHGPDSPGITSPERTFAAPGDDPISRLVDRLSRSNGLWINGASPVLDLPDAASTEQLLQRVFERTGFDAGRVTAHTLLTVRDVRIPVGSVSETYTAALVDTNLGRKIVLLQHATPTGGWWSRAYDADPKPAPVE
jgi:hypothetical protein